jgi:esterase/lipase superfamily enzyme
MSSRRSVARCPALAAGSCVRVAIRPAPIQLRRAAGWLPWIPTVLGLLLLLPARPVSAQSGQRLAVYQRFEEARAAGDWPRAATLGQEAVRLAVENAAADGIDPVDVLLGQGEVLVHTGDADEAVRMDQQALDLLEQRIPADDPALVRPLEALADACLRAKRYADAESALQRALQIENATYGEHSDSSLATLGKLRDLYQAAARPQDAARTAANIEALGRSARALPTPDEVERARRYSPSAAGFATVRVFYGTNRAATGDPRPALHYGRERGELQYGYLDVTIPATHRQGELETPSRWSLLTYFTNNDAAKRRYVLLQQVSPLSAAAFAQALRAQVGHSPSRDVLVFVHGYNSSFEDAARRTAQLAYDLDFDGTPMMYSWPSQASTAAYTVDEAAVGISGRKMAQFLDTVVAQSGASRIHLIAHSMGNRALVEALQTYLAGKPGSADRKVFGQIVFTAPDVDRDYFTDTVRMFRGIAERVTLYASNNDLALKTSEAIHGAPRAGLGGDRIITLPGLDSIDMSSVQADLIGHNYYAADAGAIYDLFRLLWRGDPPPQRCGMVDRARGAASFWVFDVSDCKGQDLLEAGVLLKRFGERARARVRARIQALKDPEQRREWSGILSRLDQLLSAAPDGGSR